MPPRRTGMHNYFVSISITSTSSHKPTTILIARIYIKSIDNRLETWVLFTSIGGLLRNQKHWEEGRPVPLTNLLRLPEGASKETMSIYLFIFCPHLDVLYAIFLYVMYVYPFFQINVNITPMLFTCILDGSPPPSANCSTMIWPAVPATTK